MNRRDAIKACALAAAGLGGALLYKLMPAGKGANDEVEPYNDTGMKEARHYRSLAGGAVRCELCFRNCRIGEGSRGFCRNRVNADGRLYNVVYGKPSAVNVEPTEKEPMHHFLPGTNMLCIGTVSCNFRCRFCHNWHLSQRSLDQVGLHRSLSPEEMVQYGLRRRVPAVSFTYNEPTVFYEYMYDVAVGARSEGIKTIFHTNGALNARPLRELLRHMDGATVDLKAFTNEFYEEICEARLEPVLETLKIIKEEGVWLEVVNLVLPGYNDRPEETGRMCRWIVSEVGGDTPLHFSRFSPSYRMTDLSHTPVSTLERCREIAHDAGVRYVSIGNVPGHEANSSFCPRCGTRFITRRHFTVVDIKMENGSCATCGMQIPGVWR